MDGALNAGQKAAVLSEKTDPDATLGAEAHQSRTDRYQTDTDDPLQSMNRDTQQRLLLHADQHRLAVLAQVGMRNRHVKRVQQLSQGTGSSAARGVWRRLAAAKRRRYSLALADPVAAGRHTGFMEQLSHFFA